ncbi:MAG: GNAT family N-acetyltransferase [Candidatus Elarobacter sp.]
MSWTLRRATAADAPLLGEHRANVWRDAGGHSDAEVVPQIPIWTAWFAAALANGTYLAWIAGDANGGTVGSGGMLLRDSLPRPGFPINREGRVHSVYVVPEQRRRRVGRALMEEMIEYARAAALSQLVLHPSDDGRGLYAGLGFTQIDDMALRFSPPP